MAQMQDMMSFGGMFPRPAMLTIDDGRHGERREPRRRQQTSQPGAMASPFALSPFGGGLDVFSHMRGMMANMDSMIANAHTSMPVRK